jgi:hypothetical protein
MESVMAMEDNQEPDATALQEVVDTQMPGWRIVSKRPATTDAADHHAPTPSPGPSLAALKKKFLGAAALADNVNADPAAEVEAEPAEQVSGTIVRIEPVSGEGPARVAEIQGGKIKVLSG